jgi:hypothetical protein
VTLDDIINVAGPLVGANPFTGLGPTDFDKEYEIERKFMGEMMTTAVTCAAEGSITASSIADASITADKIAPGFEAMGDWTNEWLVTKADQEIASMSSKSTFASRGDPLFGSW